jgi:hypothetical protein
MTLAAKLNTLTAEKLRYLKQQTRTAAIELTAEKNRNLLLSVVASLIDQKITKD